MKATELQARIEVRQERKKVLEHAEYMYDLLTKAIEEFGITMMLHRQFCKPSVDCEGNVHMSESRLCPSVGNVNTDNFADIWQRMREFRPCGHCRQYRKFMESPRPDIAAARAVMGL